MFSSTFRFHLLSFWTKKLARVTQVSSILHLLIDPESSWFSNSNIDYCYCLKETHAVHVTDESPPTCNVFLGEQGLELFMKMLQALEEEDNDNRVQVETKILGLLVSCYYQVVYTLCIWYLKKKKKMCVYLRDMNLLAFAGILAFWASRGSSSLTSL